MDYTFSFLVGPKLPEIVHDFDPVNPRVGPQSLDERNHKLNKAYPSDPVQILGFETVPNAGDTFVILNDETGMSGYYRVVAR